MSGFLKIVAHNLNCDSLSLFEADVEGKEYHSFHGKEKAWIERKLKYNGQETARQKLIETSVLNI